VWFVFGVQSRASLTVAGTTGGLAAGLADGAVVDGLADGLAEGWADPPGAHPATIDITKRHANRGSDHSRLLFRHRGSDT